MGMAPYATRLTRRLHCERYGSRRPTAGWAQERWREAQDNQRSEKDAQQNGRDMSAGLPALLKAKSPHTDGGSLGRKSEGTTDTDPSGLPSR